MVYRKFDVDQDRIDSTGSILAAKLAGIKPEANPIKTEMTTPNPSDPQEVTIVKPAPASSIAHCNKTVTP